VIHGVKPTIDGGKDGKLVKMKLQEIGSQRLEALAVWYLSQRVFYKDSQNEWRSKFKYSPTIAVMLSTAFWNQLKSEEVNAVEFWRNNEEWLSRLYQREESVFSSMVSDLTSKFKKIAHDKGNE
jgi:hypothetical protein